MNWDDPLAITSAEIGAASSTPKPPAAEVKTEVTTEAKAEVKTEVKTETIEIKTPPADEVLAAQTGEFAYHIPKTPTPTELIKAEVPSEIPKFTNAAKLNGGVNPVNADDKRVVNGETDINQLAPFKYPWAWEYFLNANKNHWTPLDINMAQDVSDYHHKLTLEEKHVYVNVLSYLTTSDILAMRNIGLAVMEKMSAPELQIYQARQVFEESLHTWTYQHCIETLGLDQGEVYNRYRVVPEINAKIQIANRRLDSVMRPDIDMRDRDELHNFLLSYIFFAGIFEGCWFYNGFTPIFALQRRGLMKGTAEQFQYIMRDEVMHANFGLRVAQQIMREEKISPDPKAMRFMWDECEAAETGYANYLLKDPILGYSAELHIEQFRYIANRRASRIGLPEPFPGADNVLPWLDEQANMRKEKNFFETRVTEYQVGGGLTW